MPKNVSDSRLLVGEVSKESSHAANIRPSSKYWEMFPRVIGVIAQVSANQLYQTAYHFQPPQNWMNGPLYYKGVYHLFYQCNPEAATWRIEIVWGHSISHDLINWIHLDNALLPSEPYDINGCWSGSITLLRGDVPVVLYTGVDSQGVKFKT